MPRSVPSCKRIAVIDRIRDIQKISERKNGFFESLLKSVMNYQLKDFSFPSADGKHRIAAHIYAPKAGNARGIIQLSHGMIDYVGRYEGLADFLTGEGFVFAGNEHLGHGASAGGAEDLGFFGEKSAVDWILDDLYTMNYKLREEYPDLPLIFMGHSMGSFLARLYIEKYPSSASAVIIHGTGGPNPLLPMGKALGAMIELFRGPRYRSRFVASLAFSGYNSRFPKEEGDLAWLTRDVARVSGRGNDPYTNFIFTVSGYRDLFRMVGGCNSKEWFENYPKAMRTLIISGDMDPVGNFGKGPDYVYRRLLLNGCADVTLKLYPGARHELFNEQNRDEVFADMLAWITDCLK